MLTNQFYRQLSRCLFMSLLLSIGGYSLADSPVEQSMETMQKAYKKALKSQSIQEFSVHFATLQKATDQASQLRFGKTQKRQATYKDGLHELQADLADIQDAIRGNDLSKAKDLLSHQVNQTKKTYHQDLKVEEDEHHERNEHERQERENVHEHDE